ncbi:FtsX-like permease family protein [Myxococcus vastator]|uniref:FtsX-like permease family protein n=1 Tax=Myxococcus vastator TaxID=2709664 RepID=UPI0013D7C609|nr:FtsX-like permease family protein [Myxococcus vastator]
MDGEEFGNRAAGAAQGRHVSTAFSDVPSDSLRILVESLTPGVRRGELGIRLALGARAAQVAGMVVLQSQCFTVLGLLGALSMGQVLSALLFEMSPTDPLVLTGVCGLLMTLAVVASYAPARPPISGKRS